jgi:thymidylate synthase
MRKGVKEQVERKPFHFPTLKMVRNHESINDYSVGDFILENYQSHPPIKMEMRK